MNEMIQNLIEHYRQNGITLSVMLTEQCNFQCGHCFYGCGPEAPKGYMPAAVRRKVVDWAFHLMDEWEIPVQINVIGGEPTLHMGMFARCLEDFAPVEAHDLGSWCMTTNGWWMHTARTASRFLEAVWDYCDPDEEVGLKIRVSNDRFHSEFRPVGFNPQSALDAIVYGWGGDVWESGRVRYPGEMYEDFPVVVQPDTPDYSWVVPSGVRGEWGKNDHGIAQDGCSVYPDLTFNPKGQFTDGCCSGSHMLFGNVNDHPLILAALMREFQDRYALSCKDCREWASHFRKDGDLEETKNQLQREALPTLMEGGLYEHERDYAEMAVNAF